MPRPHFTLKSLLWLMVVVAAFLGGMTAQKKLDRPLKRKPLGYPKDEMEYMVLRDGTVWIHSDIMDKALLASEASD